MRMAILPAVQKTKAKNVSREDTNARARIQHEGTGHCSPNPTYSEGMERACGLVLAPGLPRGHQHGKGGVFECSGNGEGWFFHSQGSACGRLLGDADRLAWSLACCQAKDPEPIG